MSNYETYVYLLEQIASVSVTVPEDKVFAESCWVYQERTPLVPV